MTDIKSPISILKDPKILNTSEQKDSQPSTVNDNTTTKSSNVIRVILKTIGTPKGNTLEK